MSIDTEYIEVESALKRVGGNVALYKKLLTLFLNESHVDELCTAVESGKNVEAIQMAHTIKGVSANLSLMKLNKDAASIEAQLKEGKDCRESMCELRATFDETTALINEYIG